MDKQQLKKQEEIAILVDGNNFYRGLEKSNLASRFNLNLFDYDKLVVFLADGRKVISKKYYKGVVKKEEGSQKSQKMVSDQQSLFSRLINNGWDIGRGKMSKNTEWGKCEGAYLWNKKINNKCDLETLSGEVSKEYQFCYHPIVIITPDILNWELIQKALGKTQDKDVKFKTLEGFILH